MGSERQADNERYQALWRAKRERDVGFLIEWVERLPDENSLPARWLVAWREPGVIPGLLRMLRSGRVETRRTAAHLLGDLGPPAEAREPLVAIAVGDADPGARSWALGAIGKYRDRALLPMLVAALRDPRWQVRNGAAAGLGELGDAAAIEPLTSALREIRFQPVAWYLGRTAIKKALRQLRSSA